MRRCWRNGARLVLHGAFFLALPPATHNTIEGRIVARGTDSTFWPEGIDFNAGDHSFYVTSVRHGTVARVDRNGRWHTMWNGDSLRVGAVLAVRVDASRGVLWVSTSGIPQWQSFAPQDSAISTLLRIGLRSGVIERRWDFPVAHGGHALGEIALGPTGEVYITDSVHPTLYILRADRDTIEAFSDSLFRSLQGALATPDGRVLYIADYSRGLLRMDLRARTVSRVTDAAGNSTRGCDGLAWDGADIIAVQNGASPARLLRITLAADGRHIVRTAMLAQPETEASEPTAGIVVGTDFVFVANSQWNKHDSAGGLLTGVKLDPPLILALPLHRLSESHRSR